MQNSYCHDWLFPLRRQVHRVYDLATAELAGHLLGMALMCAVSVGQVPTPLLMIWGSAQLLILLLRLAVLRAYQTARYYEEEGATTSPHSNLWSCPCRWGMSYLLGVFCSGTVWGMTVFMLAYATEPAYHAVLVSGIFVLAGSAMVTLGSVLSLYLLFVLPMLLPIAGWLLLHPDPLYNVMAFAAFVYLFYTFMAAKALSQSVQKLHDKNEEILSTQREILLRLGRAGGYRDTETGEHIQRMSRSCYLLSLQAGLGQEFAELMLYASPMHDVGKIGIADQILLKPGKLDEVEWAVMQNHTLIGKDILDGHSCEIMQLASRIAETHHERWDGSGYPNGLAGEQIPVEGRITAICDVFDALTSSRPYKQAWSEEQAAAFIREQSGKHFDPLLAEHFLAILPEVLALKNTLLPPELRKAAAPRPLPALHVGA